VVGAGTESVKLSHDFELGSKFNDKLIIADPVTVKLNDSSLILLQNKKKDIVTVDNHMLTTSCYKGCKMCLSFML
jgi:hypothetical protein